MRRPPAVWVVILNWNGVGDTLDCLHSLKQLRYENLSVVVVDNGSAPSEADQIERSGLARTVLRRPGNLGYAAGCNVGIQHALGQNADYMWLLNNDTIIDRDCLDALMAVGEKDDRIGLLSPIIYEYAAPHAIQFAGTVVDLPGERRPTLTSPDHPAVLGNEGRLALWGTALLVKRRVVERIGILGAARPGAGPAPGGREPVRARLASIPLGEAARGRSAGRGRGSGEARSLARA